MLNVTIDGRPLSVPLDLRFRSSPEECRRIACEKGPKNVLIGLDEKRNEKFESGRNANDEKIGRNVEIALFTGKLWVRVGKYREIIGLSK